MRRRELIALLVGAAAAPLVARAQQTETMRRIGVLMNRTADDVGGRTLLTAKADLTWTSSFGRF
jgi:hypothetical protein